ncbi:MAG: PQQ-dependent sugar dehydrogenase [Planctomycetes bacterium]|nr:PQQ-dependent sugar dehydrogenase [Planctomycetota bacterium]MBI3833903.1 PQQ-dependent sugar dehydrogenase [Planctomycetota bacterium]
MKSLGRMCLGVFLVSAFSTVSARAASHLWRINEIFSNANGTVQFIELKESLGSSFENALGGKTMTDQVNGSSFTVPSNIVGNTANKFILFATSAFAALPGAPTPDFIIPAHFFAVNGDTIHWAPVFNYDNFTYGSGALPTNGTSSIQITNFTTHTFVTGPNSPTNFAGSTGSVDASCIDNDGDGYGSPGNASCLHGSATDCNDNNPAIHPGATENCTDGIDNDCNNLIDCADPACLSAPPCVPPPTGACCRDQTGVCTETQTQSACQGGGGRYGGNNSTCATINPPCVPPPDPDFPIGLQVVASGLPSPLIVTNAGDDRLFIVDQNGQITVLQNGSVLPTPFLDISSRIIPLGSFYDERGLLGLAFHPNYLNNGKFYVRYSHPRASTGTEPCDLSGFDPGCHEEVLAQYSVTGDPHTSNVADFNSEVILFRADKPQFNHNAGQVMFGPDGYLYFSLGDGGGANDGLSDNPPSHGPNGNGQNMQAALGKMHRIDVDNPQNPLPYGIPADNPFADGVDGLATIYASGLRNPFRFSFDDQLGGDGKLYLGEVGQDLFEEVDIVQNGGNYGWVIREALHCFDAFDTLHPPASCATTGPLGEPLLNPVMEYIHPEGCNSDADCAFYGLTCNIARGLCNNEGGLAIVGGFVYRGSAYPPLYGKYVFGDFSADFGPTGRLYYFDLTGPDTYVRKEFNVRPAGTIPGGAFSGSHLHQALKGFGRDSDGELYVCASNSIGPAGTGGFVYRIVPAEAGSFGATPRYLDVTPPVAGFPFALMVKPSCANSTAKYVGAPDPNDIALLVDNPANAAYLRSNQWGTTVHVTGLDVVPSTIYEVMADYGTPGSPALSGATETITRHPGDVVDPFNPPSPTDQPDIRDVSAIVDGFKQVPTALPVYRLDLVGGASNGCVPQQVINISDIAAAVDAFKGLAYVCPTPCP